MKQIFWVLGFLVIISLASAETYFYSGISALALKNDEGITFLHHDRLGTNIKTKSLPFGQTITSEERFGYTGKEKDNSGLHYYQARYLDTNTGRFTSTDPVPNQPSYQYVGNNPINLIDPSGMAMEEGMGFGGIVAGTMVDGKMQYDAVSDSNLRELPGRLERFGEGNVKELYISRLELKFEYYVGDNPDVMFPAREYSVLDSVNREKEGWFNIVPEKYGALLAPYLASDARIIITGISDQEHSDFVKGLSSALPGRTIDALSQYYGFMTLSEGTIHLSRFSNDKNLYSPVANVNSIDEWDKYLAQGLVIKVNRGLEGWNNPEMFFHQNVVSWGRRDGFAKRGSDGYNSYMDRGYRQELLSRSVSGSIQALAPTSNTAHPLALKLDSNFGWLVKGDK